MKRLITAAVLLSICLSLSAVSSLRIFELDHPLYDEMEALFVLEGKSSPLGSKPWTETDVQHLLDRISPSSDISQNLKNRIEGYISEKESGLLFNAVINPQLLLHSNKDSFNKTDDIVSSSLLDEQAATIGLGYYYKNNVAMYMDASLGVAPSDAGDNASKRLSSLFGSNIPFLPDSLNIMNFPYNAYFNVGADALRLFIGRGQTEWGNGEMGNMMLGNTLPYHDYLTLTFTGSRHFSYQLLSSFFSHSENKDKGDREQMHGLRFFLGHRFEFAFFDDKLTFAVNDGLMYQAENGYFDLRLLNPLFFMHNGFMAYHSNSLLTLEAEYSPIKNLSIYAQVGIDDLAVAGEPKPGESGGSANGVGAMAGLRWTVPISDKSYSYGNAEFVYTSPYMYHRALESGGGSNDLYYVSSTRYMNNGLKFVERYLSFPFGSDALACQLQAGYNTPGLYDIKAKAFFMAHGVMDKNSTIRQYRDGDKVVHAPSTSNPLASTPGSEDKGGVVEYTLRTGLEAEYRPLSYLPINAGIYLITVWNKGNYSVPVCFDVQFNLGFKLIY